MKKQFLEKKNMLLHVFSGLKESVKCCRFLIPGVILKSSSSNILSKSVSYAERRFGLKVGMFL